MILREAYIGEFNLSGYQTKGEAIVKEISGKRYSVQHYQGKHEGEYTIMEVNKKGEGNGKAQLFKKGVLQLSWKMSNGKREGKLTVYKKGAIDRVLRWDDLRQASKEGDDYHLKSIVNDKSGKALLEEMIVGNGVVVYRGEFNSESRKREGFGIEYDEVSGVEKRSGYYKNDKLVHLCQEFEEVVNEEDGSVVMEMTEYGGESDENNVNDYLNCCPIYIGGYAFDANQFRYIRGGVGHALDEYIGICDWIGEWDEEGEMKEGSEIELHGGWYGIENDDDNQSIRISQLEEDELTKGVDWNKQLKLFDGSDFTQSRGIEELTIDNNLFTQSYGNISRMKMNLSEFKRLKRIEIGNDHFQNVRELVIDSLKRLKSVEIGDDCFRIGDDKRDDGVCKITNCPNLSQLEIGDRSFIDFKSLELSKLRYLKSIAFGKYCFNCTCIIILKGE